MWKNSPGFTDILAGGRELLRPGGAVVTAEPAAGKGRTRRPALGGHRRQRWGECAAAAARWELLLGRLVPESTEAGQHGKVVTGILSDGKIASQYDRVDRRHCGYPLRFDGESTWLQGVALVAL
jgi:hypothetical protein